MTVTALLRAGLVSFGVVTSTLNLQIDASPHSSNWHAHRDEAAEDLRTDVVNSKSGFLSRDSYLKKRLLAGVEAWTETSTDYESISTKAFAFVESNLVCSLRGLSGAACIGVGATDSGASRFPVDQHGSIHAHRSHIQYSLRHRFKAIPNDQHERLAAPAHRRSRTDCF
jgi:hypothetical protein